MREKFKKRGAHSLGFALTLSLLGACGGAGGPDAALEGWGSRPARTGVETEVLLYSGTGTAPESLKGWTEILEKNAISYKVVSSARLNELSVEDLRKYRMILWPGGLAKTMSSSLSEETRDTIRRAVRDEGVAFLGICAGAFITGSYEGGWGFEFLNFDVPYYYLEDEGYDREMVEISYPDGSVSHQVWYGGPELSDWGRVVGRYSNGDAAMVQGWVDQGWITLAGPHPEATNAWRAGLTDRDGEDHARALELLLSTLSRTPLPSF